MRKKKFIEECLLNFYSHNSYKSEVLILLSFVFCLLSFFFFLLSFVLPFWALRRDEKRGVCKPSLYFNIKSPLVSCPSRLQRYGQAPPIPGLGNPLFSPLATGTVDIPPALWMSAFCGGMKSGVSARTATSWADTIIRTNVSIPSEKRGLCKIFY